MPSEYEVREAYAKGAKDGALEEYQSLRTFTGLPYIVVPDRDAAEHLAYPAYEAQLQHILAAQEVEAERLQARKDRFEQESEEAQTVYHDVLAELRADRQEAGLFGKMRSVAAEPFLLEKGTAKDAEGRLSEVYRKIEEHNLKLDALRAEYAAVTQWVDDMYAATMEAGQRRADDRIAAARDISPRRFQVFTMSNYLAGDERRQQGWPMEMPGGADFGYNWRRDGDDDSTYGDPRNSRLAGQWRAIWIPENKEAAVFIKTSTNDGEVVLFGSHIQSMSEARTFFAPLESLQRERNSLALLMDAYTETYLRA